MAKSSKKRRLPSEEERGRMRAALGTWKDNWWTACREWKLVIRAECHYRYFLYNAVFQTWKLYLFHQKEKNNRFSLAKAHADQSRRSQALKRWRKYIEIRRIKHWMQLDAIDFREGSLLRISWSLWKKQQIENRDANKMADLALRHWAQRLKSRSWRQWAAVRAEAERVAGQDRRRRLKAAFSRFVAEWRQAAQRKAHLFRLRQEVAHLAGRAARRRAFGRWERYVALRKEAFVRSKMADHHYRLHLLASGFGAFRKNVTEVAAKQTRTHLAQQQRRTTVSRRAWERWRLRMEEMEEQQQRPRALQAGLHFRETWSRRFWSKWQLRAERQRKDNVAERLASAHWALQVLGRWWGCWHGQALSRRAARGRLQEAQGRHRQRALRQALRLWRQRLEQAQDRARQEGQAGHFRSRGLLAKAWQQWRQEGGQRDAAQRHCQRNARQRAFAAWKVYHWNVKRIVSHVEQKEETRRREALRHSLRTWKGNVAALREEAAKETLAQRHFAETTLRKATLLWRTSAILGLHKREEAVAALATARRRLEAGTLRACFRRWRSLAEGSVRERRLGAAAGQHCDRGRLRRGLLLWKRHHHHCLRKQLLQRQGERFRARSLLAASLVSWKQQLLLHRQEALRTRQALWLWSRRLQEKALRAWAWFAQERRRQGARVQRAAEAHRSFWIHEGATRLLRYASRRKAAWATRQAEREREASAVRHQAVVRCFSLWKRKALRRPGTAPPPPPPKKRVTFGEEALLAQPPPRRRPRCLPPPPPSQHHDDNDEEEEQLRAELGAIGQRMRQHHESQQELKSFQRRVRLLRKWQEVRAEGEGGGDSQEVEGVLDQLQLQVHSLEAHLAEEKSKMAACLSRLQEIRKTLNA